MRFSTLLLCLPFALTLTAAEPIKTEAKADPLKPVIITGKVTNATPLVEGPNDANIVIWTSRILKRSHYLKVRDRASYEFAAASAAVGIELEADGKTIRDVRIALGGVATKPWRLHAVEASLKGKTLDEATLRTAAATSVEGGKSSGHNAFKIELAPKVVARALMTVGDIA